MISPQQSKNPYSQQLTQIELEKRNSELNARETSLEQREVLLENAPLSVKVLDETIKSKQRHLDKIKSDIDKAIITRQRQTSDLDLEIGTKHEDIELAQRSLKTINNLIISDQIKLEKFETDKKSIQDEIIQRRQYQKEQEKTINAAIEDGNFELRSLQLQIQELVKSKKDLEIERAEIENEIVEIRYSLIEFQKQDQNTRAVQEKALSELDEPIKEAKRKLRDILARNKLVSDETDAKLLKLRTKEAELIARESAVHKQEVDIKTARRRLEGLQSLYDS